MALGKKTGGRKAGTPNKENKVLREMILQALYEQDGGGVEYLKYQATKNPTAFLSLLGKVMPLQVTGDEASPLRIVNRIELVPLSGK